MLFIYVFALNFSRFSSLFFGAYVDIFVYMLQRIASPSILVSGIITCSSFSSIRAAAAASASHHVVRADRDRAPRQRQEQLLLRHAAAATGAAAAAHCR